MDGYSQNTKNSDLISLEGKVKVTKAELIDVLIKSIGLRYGTITIVVQDCKVVHRECSVKFKDEKEFELFHCNIVTETEQ